ncbi:MULTISPECIES: MaoC family dehydratase [Chelativorans]|jgi:acyl dehydratase|uniref:MaoC-like dehydratase n=1 Tax=Chelativorans sp. (strain BNC1) TaxID=266779 RepID=Q11GC2_CHESB|nr:MULTISPECIES: MaoC family dehydratase [Chelativorans]
MNLDAFLKVGEAVTLGSHTFTAEEIKHFAAKYDPQPFHMDEEAARKSLLGGLCASGWHTCTMWMRYNLAFLDSAVTWTGSGPRPEFGPSPGFSELKWLRPVYAGDTITFTRTILGHRPLASRPGWRLVSQKGGAFNSRGEAVLEFESAVLLKVV